MIYDITLTVVDSSTSTTHAGAAVSIEVVQVVGQVRGATWEEVTGKPDTFPPSAHTQGSETVNTTQTDDATTSRTLADEDHGKVLRFTNGSSVSVSVPNTLRPDFACTVVQFGAGQITFTGSSASIRNRQSHTKTAGQYAAVSLAKVASGDFVLMGDTSA